MAPIKSSVVIRTISPGYYSIRPRGVYGNREYRTDLQDILEVAASLPKDRLISLMEYFKKALACKRRYRLPDFKRYQPGQEQVQQGLENFTLFPKLPLELRTMVWQLSLPGSRILELDCVGLEYHNRASDAKRSQREVLNIAQSCTEANSIVSKQYARLPLSHLQRQEVARYESYDVATSANFYREQTYLVDYEKDIFYFAEGTLHFVVFHEDRAKLSKIKNMAFAIYDSHPSKEELLPKPFKALEKLTNVVFVGDCGREIAGYEYQFDPKTFAGELESLHREDALPIHRTVFQEEPDHPFIALKSKEINCLRTILADEEVKEAYQDVNVTFELWRR